MAERAPKDPIPPDPDKFTEAVNAFRRRVPMPADEWDLLTQAEREHAFKVAGVAQADLAQEVHDALERAIRDGTTLDDFKREMGDRLAEAWGGDDPVRMETVFRTNVLSAYNAGRHEVFSAPAVRRARPYLRFDAVGDSRTSEICEELDGKILPADDPFWKKHTPPLHFNCRSILVALSPEEAEEEGIAAEAPETEAEVDDGFGREPTTAGKDWQPDTSGYAPEIRAALDEKLDR
jgi:SPP1 gp7 family putative phage head morphogenesis protein